MKKEILAEEVDQIIQQSFWGKGGLRLTESTEQGQEEVQEEVSAEEEQIEEAVEAHVCPLCESHLEEAISDEKLAEHVDFMVGIINEMEDISDDDLTELAEELVSEEDEEVVEAISLQKKPAISLQKPVSLQKRPSPQRPELAQKATSGRLPRPGDAPGNFG